MNISSDWRVPEFFDEKFVQQEIHFLIDEEKRKQKKA
jgi:hypothetical protein